MLSRDADSCYWIGRYIERAEATARMVDVHYHATLETAGAFREEAIPLRWHSLLNIAESDELYRERYGDYNDRDVLHFFAFDERNPDSILQTWRLARENARSIREQISSEMWEALNISYLELREWNVDRALASAPHTYFQLVKNASHLFQGILNRTMLMSDARDWLDVGRFLERGGQTARLLDVKYHDLLPAYQPPQSTALSGNEAWGVGGLLDMHGWIAVLKSVSAFEMYRKTNRSGISPAGVVDFLVLHPHFPASLRHCIGRVQGCLKRVRGAQADEHPNPPERIIGRLHAELAYARPEEIIASGLHEYLAESLRQCDKIGEAITSYYLSY